MVLRRTPASVVAVTALATVAIAGILSPWGANADAPAVFAITSFPSECLVVGPVGWYGRAPFHQDPIEAQLVAGLWQPPEAGTEGRSERGSPRKWQPLRVDKDGWFRHAAFHGGYAYATVQSPDALVMILEAAGHSLVYVNGEPRAGDPYAHGYVHLPVALRRGKNHFLFAVAQGQFNARLTQVKRPALLNTADWTLPDLHAGKAADTEGAVVVVNATAEPAHGLLLRSALDGGTASDARVPTIPPLGVCKVPFPIRGPAHGPGGEKLEVSLLRTSFGEKKVLDKAEAMLHVCKPGETYRQTFRSSIDGSLQYYAVTPSPGGPNSPGLMLTLHGAGVEAIGQAWCYAPKAWAHTVAPTNRRPFGFDWEDWGRLDALEVLAHAKRALTPDPQRVYLTGHSMGGHGVWHLGVTYPDHWAAIGPSAGWVSMWSYAGARLSTERGSFSEILGRCTLGSDTLKLVSNLGPLGVYVLHGDRDDNVPVEQARIMKSSLTGHADFVYHEQPGAGHWWGNACVDWAPMMGFLSKHRLPDAGHVKDIDFTTATPGVSASCYWATIHNQEHPLQLSRVELHWSPAAHALNGRTRNVSRFAVDLRSLGVTEAIVALDGMSPQRLRAVDGTLWLEKRQDRWHSGTKPPPRLKAPDRYGPFKEAFHNHVLFVYGTKGTATENAWALAKARYDSEVFWYRGNGAVDILPDTQFRPDDDVDRNVVLYGNVDTNGAWNAVMADSPVLPGRGRVRVGKRDFRGEELACLLVRPRKGSGAALAAAVAGSGLAGMRLTDRLPYFVSGIGYPDFLVFDGQVLRSREQGIRAAGFFGDDWSLEKGDFAYERLATQPFFNDLANGW